MHAGRVLGALLSFIPGLALAGSSAPLVPDTPAGHVLGSWLAAFNSGDRARIDTFDRVHLPWLSLDTAMDIRAHTGGYELGKIEQSSRLWIIVRAKVRVNAEEAIVRLAVH